MSSPSAGNHQSLDDNNNNIDDDELFGHSSPSVYYSIREGTANAEEGYIAEDEDDAEENNATAVEADCPNEPDENYLVIHIDDDDGDDGDGSNSNSSNQKDASADEEFVSPQEHPHPEEMEAEAEEEVEAERKKEKDEDEDEDNNDDEQFTENMTKWQADELGKMAKKIDKKLADIERIQKQIVSINATIEQKKEEHGREWTAREKGENELQKILDKKKEHEDHLDKKRDELAKTQNRLQLLQHQESEIRKDPRPGYMKHLKAAEKKSQKIQKIAENNIFLNLDEGDDSLPDESGAERTNAVQACRRCKHLKVACKMVTDKQCQNCFTKGLKCRFRGFPFAPGKQLRPYQVEEMDRELNRVKKRLASYQLSGQTSLLADNPLSGITGYGPRPPSFARQNYARLSRGLPPIIKPFPGMENTDGSGQRKRKEASEAKENEDPQHAKRQKSFDTAQQPAAVRQFINQTTSIPGSSKRGKKPGQTLRKHLISGKKPVTTSITPEKPNIHIEELSDDAMDCSHSPPQSPENSQGSDYSDREQHDNDDDYYGYNMQYSPTQTHLHVPRFDVTAVNNMQEWWAYQLSLTERCIPVDKGNKPKWPEWTLSANLKQSLWFRSFGSQDVIPMITLMDGGDDDGNNDVANIQPDWPGWTMVDEELSKDQRNFLVQQLATDKSKLQELRGENGKGEGRIDWTFH